MTPGPAARMAGIELSLIRQINALATPLSINLGIGEPNVVPDAQLRAMAERATRTSWGYSPNAGTLGLRKKLAANTELDPKSEICVTAGTQEGLHAIFTALVDPGDEVLIPDPGFLSYGTLARLSGATAVPYHLEPPDWSIDLAALRKTITPRTKLIVVNSPSNPLGSVVPLETLQEIAALGPVVVSDEVYREIYDEERPASMAGMARSVLTVNGFSKSHAMTGLRLGWIAGPADLMEPIVKAHQYIATCASVFSQALAEAILGEPEWNEAWLRGVREQFAAQRDAALLAVQRELEVDLPRPAGAFYLFVPVPACETVAFAKALATEAAVLVIPGVAFGPRGQGFIRISYAAAVEQVTSGIERIGRYLREQGR